MKVFIDTSALLRKLFQATGAFASTADWEQAVASELLWVEACRAIDRLRILEGLADSDVAGLLVLLRQMMARFEQVPILRTVLDRAASPFPTIIRTNDAIHLASALLWMEEHQESLLLVTHDQRLAIAARACGLQVKTSPD